MGYGNDNVSITGTEMKFALSLELPGGLTMDEVGFEAPVLRLFQPDGDDPQIRDDPD